MEKLEILHTSYVTHDTKRIVLKKPDGLMIKAGTAAHFSVNKPGWEEQSRPFTFTSLNEWPELELTVKIYEDHEGVTDQIGKLTVGDELLLHDTFDTIKYKGKGLFLAGGTGITPFIAVFRALYLSNNIQGHGLLYSNKTQQDIIYGDELYKMLGNSFQNVFTRQGVIGFRERHIDKAFLIENIGRFDLQFYVCGPNQFTKDVTAALIDLGADPESVEI